MWIYRCVGNARACVAGRALLCAHRRGDIGGSRGVGLFSWAFGVPEARIPRLRLVGHPETPSCLMWNSALGKGVAACSAIPAEVDAEFSCESPPC